MQLFVSPEERQRREAEYQKRIFPLGTEQRALALSALRPLMNKRLGDSEILYAFIVAKQKYQDAERDLSDAAKYLKKAGGFSEHERRCILALVLLDDTAASLEAYPDQAAVSAHESQVVLN